ncbi:hypothetical protein ABGB07_15230 [Micromonosporaceae bacterium B7E4]
MAHQQAELAQSDAMVDAAHGGINKIIPNQEQTGMFDAGARRDE